MTGWRTADGDPAPGCGKKRFRDELSAKMALARIAVSRERVKSPQRAYRCPLCGGWHLTSQPKGVSR